MGANNKYSRHGSNHIREYCKHLVDDFFRFCDGHPEQVTTMVWMNDINKPMPPNKEQMGKMLKRLLVIWQKFCKDATLPRTIENLFLTMIKEEWNKKSKEQEVHQLKTQKRKNKSHQP